MESSIFVRPSFLSFALRVMGQTSLAIYVTRVSLSKVVFAFYSSSSRSSLYVLSPFAKDVKYEKVEVKTVTWLMAIVKQFKTLHCWCKTFRNNTKTLKVSRWMIAKVDRFCTKVTSWKTDDDHVCPNSTIRQTQRMFRSCPTYYNRYARADLQTISNILTEEEMSHNYLRCCFSTFFL